jgi:hypothetical protein
MGMRDERKAREAEAAAIGIAMPVIHLIPHRFTNVKNKTIAIAITSTGRLGKYHCWIAADERSAVSPQAGRAFQKLPYRWMRHGALQKLGGA